MKCNHCGSAWDSISKNHLIFCPFCNMPLDNINIEFSDLYELLSYLVLEYGDGILGDRRNAIRFIEYYFSKGVRELSAINIVYSSGTMEAIFRFKDLPITAQTASVKQVRIQLVNKYGLSSEWAHYVTGSICKCLGLANDLDSSAIYLTVRAEKGDPICCYELAKLYLNVGKWKQSNNQYLYWLGKAVEMDYNPALYEMGKYLFESSLYDSDEERAMAYIEQAVKSGNKDALAYLCQRNDIAKRCNLDIDLLVSSAAQLINELTVQQLIGFSQYYLAQGDVSTAINLLVSAYEKDSKATWRDYYQALKTCPTIEHDAVAQRILREAAIDGDVHACKILAEECNKSARTETDMLSVLYWLKNAAEKGDVESQIKIAQIYEQGDRIAVNIDEAVNWYKIAAFNGSSMAKQKISYKSEQCISRTITLMFEDDSEIDCRVLQAISIGDCDYLIILDPETGEKRALLYREVNTIEGFEVEGLDERTEYAVLNHAL